MNIIINGFNNTIFTDLLTSLIEELKPGLVTMLTECPIAAPDGVEIERIPVWNAIWARYRIDWNGVKPLEEELVLSMAECETTVLRMMDRLEQWRYISYRDRKIMYLRHLRFWNDYLERKQVAFFLASNIPHEVYDYVLYCLCRRKSIDTLMLHQAPTIPDRVFITRDHREFMSELRDVYTKALAEAGNIRPEEVSLPPEFEEYYARQTDVTKKPVPFYMGTASSIPKKSALVAALARGRRLLAFSARDVETKIRQAYAISRHRKRLRARSFTLSKAYEKRCSEPRPGERYVYVPLHYQPELTTSPLAGAFVDQQLIVQLLSAVAPEGVFIYVKEHPKQTALGRSGSYYEEMDGLKNVRFIPKTWDSFALINGCMAVATATGTAGWEALFRGKPVLLFGNFFYQYADGVHCVKSARDCRSALNDIAAGRGGPNAGRLKLFLKATIEASVPGVVDDVYLPISRMTTEQNTSNLLGALRQRIEGLLPNPRQGK